MDFKQILKDTLNIKFDKAFGLDIGNRSVEIIELNKFLKFSVVAYGRIELADGIVENGKIIDQNTLAENVKKLLREVIPHKVSTNKVFISLPESQVFIKSFEVDSKLKSAALISAITDNVSLVMPVNIDKTYWDFEERSLADKTKKMIMFFSVSKEIANSYVKFCNSIGLEVTSLCIESLSLARIILKNSPKHNLIVDIGAGATNLSFFDSNDRINMSITIPTAGDHLTQVIKDRLSVEKTEAENLKIRYGFVDSAENNIRAIILPVFEGIIREVGDAIKYYEEIYNQKLDDIYIVGGSALLPGILDIMKSGLNREVQIATCNYNINLKSVIDKNTFFPLYANVISLGMLGASGEYKDINLIKKMPKAEVNSVDKLKLFDIGYLSRLNTIRTIINNKFVLALMLILVTVIFSYLIYQTKNVYFSGSNLPLPVIVPPVRVVVPPPIVSTTTATTTNTSLPVKSIATGTVSVPSTLKSPNINSGKFIFNEDKDPGTYGESVTQLQQRLTDEGYFGGLVGGFFGPATEAALKVYQKAKGIPETGKLDLITRNKLNGK